MSSAAASKRPPSRRRSRNLYICSLSCRSLIYKGMFLAEHLAAFYPDLNDPRFISRFAIYHQRYSTNTFPTWRLAQPFRVLAHNGEINTVSGNTNWMKSHETRLAAGDLDSFIDDIKPVVQAGGSDTAVLDNVFELLVHAGRDAPMAKALMIPASIGNDATMPAGPRRYVPVLQRRHGAVGRPGRGLRHRRQMGDRRAGSQRPAPAALLHHRESFADRRLRNRHGGAGRRRYHRERAASARARPSPSISNEPRFYKDAALLDLLAGRQAYGDWTAHIKKIDHIVKTDAPEPVRYTGEALRRRQLAVGMTLEELETILHPMVEDASEAIGSMGDDTPIAVLSEQYRGLHCYFRQDFSQVTNPPIDSLRETRVMTLKTRLGNLGNVLDEDSSQCDLLQLESPVLSTAEFDAMLRTMGSAAVVVDCTFPVEDGDAGLRRAIERVRRAAEEGVREGCTHVVLTDEAQGPGRVPIPNDPGHRRGAYPSRAQQPAHFHQPECARRRMHGYPHLRRADRRRRHHGERLSGAGKHRRPPSPRPVRRHEAEGSSRPLQESRRQRLAENHVQNGHFGDFQLSRRL